MKQRHNLVNKSDKLPPVLQVQNTVMMAIRNTSIYKAGNLRWLLMSDWTDVITSCALPARDFNVSGFFFPLLNILAVLSGLQGQGMKNLGDRNVKQSKNAGTCIGNVWS